MWKTAIPILSRTLTETAILPTTPYTQQFRTTFILKRKYPAPLHKKGCEPKKLRNKYFIYEEVKQTAIEPQTPIEVVLTTFVNGLGNVGDKVLVKPNYAYNNLLLPGLAVYATPENEEKYKSQGSNETQVHYSSQHAKMTMDSLLRLYLSVVMNKDHPWTLKPWHVKLAFRKCGFIVPEEAITLPDKPISGPDMNLQDKEFFVTVTINKTEKANVRCRIHHWSTDVTERIPHIHEFWKADTGPIYPEFSEILKELPKRKENEVNQN